MKTLDIRVAFSAVDRLTRPAENARRLMGQFGDSIQRTQGAIKNLERQARSFERARDAVSKADAGIVKARRQLNALNQLQRTGTVLSEKQQKLMQQLSSRLERLNESRTREIQKMRELGGELKRHGISLTGSDNTIQQAIRRTEQYNNQLERERQALARVTRARERYSRAQENRGKTENRWCAGNWCCSGWRLCCRAFFAACDRVRQRDVPRSGTDANRQKQPAV
ncbi:putative phage tail tape measure domain protein [Escherichia coli DEC13A]|nr:putative phage tail tape measure domain protein [Escherichia coli DEC13A]